MLARVQFELQPVLRAQVAQMRQAMPALSFLLNQTALASLVFALWRLGVDLGLTEQFVFTGGLFSHWQVWMVSAVALRMMASHVNRSLGSPDSVR